jgi:hypothetical protein
MPRSDLLSRAASFLPQLQTANAQLASSPAPPQAQVGIEIEAVSEAVDTPAESSGYPGSENDSNKDGEEEDAGPRVQMDITCGVLDLQDGAAAAAAKAATANGASVDADLAACAAQRSQSAPQIAALASPDGCVHSSEDSDLSGAGSKDFAAPDKAHGDEQNEATSPATSPHECAHGGGAVSINAMERSACQRQEQPVKVSAARTVGQDATEAEKPGDRAPAVTKKQVSKRRKLIEEV